MKSSTLGKNISEVEILNVSQQGLWLFVRDREYYLPYSEYPWFETATVAEICNVNLVNPDHLHWPDLDVDLEVSALQHPQDYPLGYHE